MNRKRLVAFGLVGATLTALCCFTPILAGLLGLVGFGTVVGSLDLVLFPALAGFLGLALYGLSRRNQEGGALCCEGTERARGEGLNAMTDEKKEIRSDDKQLFAELRRLSPKVTGGLLRMRQEAYRDGVIPAKYKLLAAMAISIAIRCEPCIRAYVRMACDQGITQEELIEFLDVAMTMQGCPGEEWALKAYQAYKACAGGAPSNEGVPCCAP